MKTKFITLLLFLILALPLASAQVPAPGAPGQQEQRQKPQPPPPPQGIAMLGFKKGEYPIPLDGNTIPVYAGEEVWIKANENVNLAFGVKGQTARPTQVRQGNEFRLDFPTLPCCGNTQLFEVTVSTSSKSEKAILALIGEEQLRDLDAQVFVSQAGIEVIPKSSARTPINQIALMRAGANETETTVAEWGSVKYRNVIKPQSTLKVAYSPSGLVERATSKVNFVLESSRVYKNEGTKISIFRNGTVSSSVVKLPESGGVAVNVDVPRIGTPGKGGDTPLRLGLHFLHFYLEDENGIITGNSYLPLYITEDDNFFILDYTNSKNRVALPLASRPPIRLMVFVATSVDGVVTAFASREVLLPVSRITVSDGKSPISKYAIFVEPDVPKANIGGITYLLSNSTDLTVTLAKLKVNNFTVSEFRVNRSSSLQIVFPQDVQLITRVQQLKVEATDEFGGNIVGGNIRVKRNDEEYRSALARAQTISLPGGTYSLEVLVTGSIASSHTITIDSAPQTVTIVINRLSMTDRVLAVVVLVEIIAAIIFSGLVIRQVAGKVSGIRRGLRRGSGDEEVDKSGIPLKHVD